MSKGFWRSELAIVVYVLAVVSAAIAPGVLRSIDRVRVAATVAQLNAAKKAISDGKVDIFELPAQGQWPGSVYSFDRRSSPDTAICLSNISVSVARDIDLVVDGADSPADGMLRYDVSASGRTSVSLLVASDGRSD